MDTNTNLNDLSTADLAAAASLRNGQLRRNRTQAAAQRALVARIEAALDRSPAAVVRALELLYARQTSDEQVTATTRHDNERGFSQAHASTGTWLVTTVIAEGRAQGRAERDLLRGKALDMGRTIAHRYARTQLLQVAYEKAEAERNAFMVPPPSAFGFTPEPSTVTVESLAVELGDVEPTDSRPARCVGCQWAGKCENGWVYHMGTEYPCAR
jgi:hypothetical protein